VRNPRMDALKVLGLTPAQFAAARTALEAFLTANDNKEDVDEATARASLPAAVSDRAWNHLKQVVGIA